MNRRLSGLLIFIEFILVLCSVSSMLFAQRTTGTISGVVKDESGAVVPGAGVVVKNTETGAVRSTVSNDEGAYAAPNLAPGSYEVSAEVPGFKTSIRRGIKLSVGGSAVVDITLNLGEITEEVVITSEAPLVETTTSGLSGLVESQQIRDLPLNGRDFIQLSTLHEGVVSVRTGDSNQSRGFGTKLSIGGARPSQNRFLLDGSDINDTAGATPGSAAGVMLGVDTLREFRVLTNAYSAEFGKSAGGAIIAVTKSGTNEYHGTIFEFLRNDNLDARNFFDRGPAPEFKRNQFGFSFGGPILKEKTFFFGSYEGLRERLGVTRIARVPDVSVRTSAGISPVILPYLNLYPLPNGRAFGGGIAEFLSSASDATDEDFAALRIDHRFSGADSLFGRYSFDDASRNSPNPLQLFTGSQTSRYHYLTIEETHIFSPRLLNTARFAYNTTRTGDVSITLKEIDRSLFFVPSHPQFGGIAVAGLTELSGGAAGFQPRIFNNVNVDTLEAVTYDRGSHSLKMGLGVTRYHNNNNAPFRPGGRFQFDSLQDLLQARASQLESMVPGVSDTVRRWRQWLVGMYLQDDWKATPHLTFNLGLRYEFITVPEEADGKSANLRNVPFSKESTVGPPFKNPSLRNFAPRVGVAWAPGDDGTLAIRAGVGVFYDQILSQYMILAGSRVPPFWLQANPRNPSFPDYIRTVSIRDVDPRVDTLPYDIDQPYRIQYNLSIEKQISRNLAVHTAYVGSRGVHLPRAVADANANVPQGFLDGRLFWPATRSRLNPVWSTIRYRPTDGNSFYHSWVAGLTKRFSGGLQFQASYTFGRSVDDSSAVFNENEFTNTIPVANIFDRTAERGLSDFHVAHNFVANYLWELPFGRDRKWGHQLSGAPAWFISGWQISGILNLSSGTPFTPVLSFDRARAGAGRGGGGQRPDLVSGSNNPVLGGPDRYFDASGFALPPVGVLGNLGRNTVMGPGLASFDFSLFKNSRVGENKNLQFRAEMFNVFNRANFTIPAEAARQVFSATGPIAGAGRITGTLTTSRQIQFGLKFIF
ncbi:MAG: TonB-dependent receptor [Acidobacteria bacterium]|nr:TonB-dependent receptor [Acidobacteriota bacterium]